MADIIQLDFEHGPLLLPVVHVNNLEQALRETEKLARARVDGAFLIDHHGSSSLAPLFELHRSVQEEFPALWLGVNQLGHDVKNIYKAIYANDWWVDGIWTDQSNVLFGTMSIGERQYAEVLQEYREQHEWLLGVRYFGGVAMKGQHYVADPAVAAELAVMAMRMVDVITTSGEWTDKAANPEKVRRMKAAVGDHPIAVASGVNPDNVADYGMADAYLVASSIETYSMSGEFDAIKLGQMVAAVAALKEQRAKASN